MKIIAYILVTIIVMWFLYYIFMEYKYLYHIRNVREGDIVKFYIDDIKHTGTITSIYNSTSSVQITYVDNETGKTKYHYCFINDTYPI